MIKEKFIDAIKSRVDICQLVIDLAPERKLLGAGHNRKRCCCVFHSEKNPSLVLDTSLNMYKCFGCGKGGDVIRFVEDFNGMGFVDAVKFLLRQYCPDVDTSDLEAKGTQEEKELQSMRETMYIYNQHAYEFFREQYEADNEEARQCRRYAEKTADKPSQGRWDSEFCKTFGLGYSPKRGNQFLAFAKKKGLKTDILLKLGLIAESEETKGQYYDFYRGRLMIPQRDKGGKILTFVARSLDSRSTCKYLNGRDSLIYKKSYSIFGIDVAMRAARQSGKVYLVEGAPDVMRLQSIGISNVVATLGGAWSREQLNTFSHFVCTLCFIPDSDMPKEGERFGTGEKFVFKNGRLATEMGFQVSVREIPAEDGVKEDADSYVTSMEKWESLMEKDFILWYADKHYDLGSTNDDQLKVICDVCDLRLPPQ